MNKTPDVSRRKTLWQFVVRHSVVLLRALDSYNMTQLDSDLSTPQRACMFRYHGKEKPNATRYRTIPWLCTHCPSHLAVINRRWYKSRGLQQQQLFYCWLFSSLDFIFIFYARCLKKVIKKCIYLFSTCRSARCSRNGDFYEYKIRL